MRFRDSTPDSTSEFRFMADANHRLREAPATLSIIAITAHPSPADQEACCLAGMNDLLAKPINLPEWVAVLALWLAANFPP